MASAKLRHLALAMNAPWTVNFQPLIPSLGLPQCLSLKKSTCNAGDTGVAGLIPGLGRSSGGGHGNPLSYSCLENPMDRGASQATVHGVTKSQT